MPPFPKKKDYGIKETDFDYFWEKEQLQVIDAMEEEADREIFLWLKYHYKRPSEACALHKADYDQINDAFNIKRSISARKLSNRTKKGATYTIPCAPEFKTILKKLLKKHPDSPFLFINPRARNKGKRYTIESLNNALKNACIKLNKKRITVYNFTKHSSCTQFVNEKDGSDSELQMLTGHARIESVYKYRKIDLEKKKRLMKRGKVIDMSTKKRQEN
jgi:integrase